MSLATATDQNPRAAYIHVPFCAHRCGYCNFTLVAGRDDLIDNYLQAIGQELTALREPREIDTLFFGGGTPTHLPADHLERLLELVRRWLPLAAGAEFSVEANPLDFTDSRAAVLEAAGVTRVSLGAQSFNDQKLARLERDHRAEEVEAAFLRAKQFAASVSVDLISGAPDETLEDWNDDLAAAVALGPQHISAYGLTIERGTTFWNRQARGELAKAAEDLERDMYLASIGRLTAAGFEHYEVSNFALPGYRCRHNETYWLGHPYYAFGPGAARYVNGVRETNHRSTTTYIKRLLQGGSPVAEREQLSPEDRARELLVFAMRRLEGVDVREFAAATGFELDALVADPLERLIGLGLIVRHERTIGLTRAGLLISDAIWPEFLAGPLTIR